MKVVKGAVESKRFICKGARVIDVNITTIRTTAEIESRLINGSTRAGHANYMKAAKANKA